jgi:hypothetical protein
MNAYKNIDWFISHRFKLRYFNRNTVSVDSKGVEKKRTYTGVVMTVKTGL